MAKRTWSNRDLERLSNRIAADVLESVSRSLRRAAQDGPGYQCSGIEFNCSDEYNCVAPDGCDIQFNCNKVYTAPKPKRR